MAYQTCHECGQNEPGALTCEYFEVCVLDGPGKGSYWEVGDEGEAIALGVTYARTHGASISVDAEFDWTGRSIAYIFPDGTVEPGHGLDPASDDWWHRSCPGPGCCLPIPDGMPVPIV